MPLKHFEEHTGVPLNTHLLKLNYKQNRRLISGFIKPYYKNKMVESVHIVALFSIIKKSKDEH